MLRERGPALEPQGHVGDAPAVVLLTDSVGDGDAGVVEEYLAEVALAVDRPHRPDLDAGLVHVEDQPRDPFVLGCVGIGADEQLAIVGHVGACAPDLLAVDDVLVAVPHRAGAQRREVRAGLGFREALAPHVLAPQDAREVERALFVGSFRDEGRARVHHAHEVDADVRGVGPRVLLQVHELLAHRKAPASERLRPVQARVARLRELALPRGVVGAARGPVARRWRRTVPGNLDCEPGPQLRAEPFVVVGVGQVHVVTVWRASASSASASASACVSEVPKLSSSTHARLRK